MPSATIHRPPRNKAIATKRFHFRRRTPLRWRSPESRSAQRATPRREAWPGRAQPAAIIPGDPCRTSRAMALKLTRPPAPFGTICIGVASASHPNQPRHQYQQCTNAPGSERAEVFPHLPIFMPIMLEPNAIQISATAAARRGGGCRQCSRIPGPAASIFI